MSFSADVRGELARGKLEYICCAKSELASALLIAGGIAWRGRGRYALTLTASDGATVRRFFGMLKRHWNVVGQIRALSGDPLNGGTRYQLAVPESDSIRLLEECQLLDEQSLFGLRQAPPEEITRFACCKKAFVRAAFMMSGEISNPEKSYHMEIAAPTEAFANRIVECLQYYDIPCAVTERKKKQVVYLKRSEAISDALSLLGAGAAVLKIQNIQVRKGISNHVNRQMNFDQSNINRAVDAASKQIEAIRYIESELGLDKLPKTLQDIARARLNSPETTLTALGELLNPPIGKSGVSARLRRLTEIAEKLKTGEEIRFTMRNA